MRGQVLERIVVGRENFAACGRRVLLSPFRRARRLGAPSHRVSPCGASFFPGDGKETKGSPGTAPDEHFVLIVAFPRTPVTGVIPWTGWSISGAQNLSGWSEFPPGHWALGVQNLELLRFKNCAWLCRANAPGPAPAVGATLAVARKPSPRGRTIPPIRGKCPEGTNGVGGQKGRMRVPS